MANADTTTEDTPTAPRPLGFWLRAVNGLLAREFAASLGDRGSRHDAMQAADALRERIAGAVSPDDYATTVASLEAIARELGWDAAADGDHRRRGFGHGFGPGIGHGFGRGHHGAHGEHAYERGFTAGFDRGRAAASAPAA